MGTEGVGKAGAGEGGGDVPLALRTAANSLGTYPQKYPLDRLCVVNIVCLLLNSSSKYSMFTAI
jgi:hypothetical protein